MGNKKLSIDPEFAALIPPLPEDEYAALEQSIRRDGCRDALVVWKGILVDGHNRYEICNRLGKSFRTTVLACVDPRDSAMAWMIDNQLARRNVNDFQRGELALRKETLLAAAATNKQKKGTSQGKDLLTNLSKGSAMNTRRDLAKDAGVSEGTIAKIKTIKTSAAPELVEKVRSGEVKIDVAAQVATLPKDEQVALAAAGKNALKAAAKEVRQASKQKQSAARNATSGPKESIAGPKPDAISPPEDEDELARLRNENATLRNCVEELTALSKNTEIENQLAGAAAEVQRLTELCAELKSRIAILEKENDVLALRQDMQGQKDCPQQQAGGTIAGCVDDVPMEPAESAAAVQLVSAPPTVLSDADAD